MITRGSPNEDELKESARWDIQCKSLLHVYVSVGYRGICSTEDEDRVRNELERFFLPLAQAYLTICNQQNREFFGLRDFYRLLQCSIVHTSTC